MLNFNYTLEPNKFLKNLQLYFFAETYDGDSVLLIHTQVLLEIFIIKINQIKVQSHTKKMSCIVILERIKY